MKKTIPTLLCVLLAATMPAEAQKKRNRTVAPILPQISLTDAMQQYRFQEAEELLNAEIDALSRAGQDTEEAESKLRAVQKAQNRMNATEKVVFIDSVVVAKEEMFQHIPHSDEVGSVFAYQDYFKTEDNQEGSVYLSQMKDKIYFSEMDESGQYRILTQDKLGNEWSDPSPLAGLEDRGEIQQNYPYILSDGVTLYYAAKGSESIGGYDIFMTRYDNDDHTFLTPENIGMPFNSPANDYLFIIDDFNNLGWFVTDRNQPEGKVCVYTFIPNATRKVYDTAIVSTQELRGFAMLNSIRNTWINQNEVDEALSRLAQLKEEASATPQKDNTKQSHVFIVNDERVYTKAEDFKSEKAKQGYLWWIEGTNQLQELENKLAELRTKYENQSGDGRNSLRKEILEEEVKLRNVLSTLQEQEKEIRKQELGM